MPLPYPHKKEDKKKFMDRCLSETKDEFRDIAQRYAVCSNRWQEFQAGDEDHRMTEKPKPGMLSSEE